MGWGELTLGLLQGNHLSLNMRANHGDYQSRPSAGVNNSASVMFQNRMSLAATKPVKQVIPKVFIAKPAQPLLRAKSPSVISLNVGRRQLADFPYMMPSFEKLNNSVEKFKSQYVNQIATLENEEQHEVKRLRRIVKQASQANNRSVFPTSIETNRLKVQKIILNRKSVHALKADHSKLTQLSLNERLHLKLIENEEVKLIFLTGSIDQNDDTQNASLERNRKLELCKLTSA